MDSENIVSTGSMSQSAPKRRSIVHHDKVKVCKSEPPPLIWLTANPPPGMASKENVPPASNPATSHSKKKAPPKKQPTVQQLDFVEESIPSAMWIEEYELIPFQTVSPPTEQTSPPPLIPSATITTTDPPPPTSPSLLVRSATPVFAEYPHPTSPVTLATSMDPSASNAFENEMRARMDKLEGSVGTALAPSASHAFENEMRTRMDKLERRVGTALVKLDRLLNASIPRSSLRVRCSFEFKPLENVQELEQFNAALGDREEYARQMETWLLGINSELDCRVRLNNAVESLFEKSCLAQLSWTGAGNNKQAAMNSFKHVLLLLEKVASNNSLSVNRSFIATYFKAKFKNAPARLHYNQNRNPVARRLRE